MDCGLDESQNDVHAIKSPSNLGKSSFGSLCWKLGEDATLGWDASSVFVLDSVVSIIEPNS